MVLDPSKLAAYGITYNQVRDALVAGNQESGGSVLELAEAEYMVRASGYLKTLDDFRAIPLAARGGVPVSWATWPPCSWARRCGAASPSSTAKAKSPAAWWCCARARTRRPRSRP